MGSLISLYQPFAPTHDKF